MTVDTSVLAAWSREELLRRSLCASESSVECVPIFVIPDVSPNALSTSKDGRRSWS